MQVVFSLVNRPHNHTRLGHLARTFSGSFFWDKTMVNDTDHAVLATNSRGQLVGIQKFNVRARGNKRKLISNATFVWPLYRDVGIAQKMWAHAIAEKKITHVDVTAVSDRGKTLVETLRKQFPEVEFKLVDAGKRKLRALKGAKGRRAA